MKYQEQKNFSCNFMWVETEQTESFLCLTLTNQTFGPFRTFQT